MLKVLYVLFVLLLVVVVGCLVGYFIKDIVASSALSFILGGPVGYAASWGYIAIFEE